MRVLITGASGFLGKHVLNLLVADETIESVDLVSRQSRTHPHPKVRILQMDLSEPWTGNEALENNTQKALKETDVIIHLAGLYDFKEDFTTNYQQNVLATLHLIDRARELSNPQIFFASTYAVGYGSDQILEEGPLSQLPPPSQAYSYTKALAEQAIASSGLPARIFRLGVLVGDTQNGDIEKLDGPYYLMKDMARIGEQRILRTLARRAGKLPVPYSPSGVIPLVPVDSAARIIHRALSLPKLPENTREYYGVFHTESLSMEQMARSIFREMLPDVEPWAIQTEWPYTLTGIPKALFQFSTHPVRLSNPKFREVFGADSIPHFTTYQKSFFKGFNRWLAHQ